MHRIKLIIFPIYIIGISLSAQISDKTSNQFDAKLYQLKDQLEHAKTSQDSIKISQVYLKLGDFFTNLGLYNEAITNYQAFQNMSKEKDTCSVHVQNTLARINLDLKKYEDAKKHANKSFQISEELNYSEGKANVYALLGSIAEKQTNYEQALQHQYTSLSIFESLQDSTGLAITNENIGSIYEDLEQYNIAYEYFLKAHLYAIHSDSNIQINILNNLGDAKRKTKHYDKAIYYTGRALDLAQKTENNAQIESAFKDFARTYADLGSFEKAYDYLSLQNIAIEKELKLNNIEVVSAMEVLYEVNEKEAELQLLNKQNQINKVRQYIILVATGFIILVLILGFIYWKKRRRHEKHILEYKQQLLEADLDKKTVEEAALKREIEIKVSSLTNYSLNIAHKNKMLSDISKTLRKLKDRNIALIKSTLNTIIAEIDEDLSNHNEWTELRGYFVQIHPDYFKHLNNIASEQLSAAEIRLCILLRLNLSSKEIANILHITPDSVRIARYRLRKKLPLNPKGELQEFLLNI